MTSKFAKLGDPGTVPPITREIKLELALSALTMFCNVLLREGQLSKPHEQELTMIISNIGRVLYEKTP